MTETFKVGDTVICYRGHGSGKPYRRSVVEKIYKTGNIVLTGSRTQYRARTVGGEAWASETGGGWSTVRLATRDREAQFREESLRLEIRLMFSRSERVLDKFTGRHLDAIKAALSDALASIEQKAEAS